EAIHKKLGDSLMRAVTMAFSLEAEQDSESSDDEESLGDHASKPGRIEAIDADENVTLVNDQDDVDKDMFDVNILGGEEVFAKAGQNENVVNITTEELTLAQVLEALKTSKPKLQAEFDEEERLKRERAEKEQEANIALIDTWDDILEKIDHPIFTIPLLPDFGGVTEGYKLKDLKVKEFDKIQEIFDRAFKRVNTFKDIRTELVKGKEKRAREELIQESTKKQKVEDDKKTAELKQLIEIIPDKE
nr:hypothetical protein [Tanacetum cinerariifolium]